MRAIDTKYDYDFYDDADLNLNIAICQSYIYDYMKALRKKEYDKADDLLEEFRRSRWLSYIVDDTELFIQRLFEEGEKKYGKAW